MKVSSENLEQYRVCCECLKPLYTDDLRMKRHPKCRKRAKLAWYKSKYRTDAVWRAKRKANARGYWHRVMKGVDHLTKLLVKKTAQ